MVFNKVIYLLKDRYFFLFLLCLFLIKAPPFYFIMEVNRLFSSHTLAKVVIFLIFFLFLLSYSKKVNKLVSRNRAVFIMIILYFIGQSLSVVSASDILLFLKTYHNTVVAIMIFLLSYFLCKTKENKIGLVNNFVVATGVILIVFELLFFLFPSFLLSFFNFFIQKEVMDAYLTNIARGRYSLDLNVEQFLPFFLIAIFLKNEFKRKSKIFFSCVILTVVFLSVLSNFRSRVMVLFFSLSPSLLLFFIKRKSPLYFTRGKFIFFSFIGAVAFLISSTIAILTSNYLYSFNVVDRVLLQDEYWDVGTVTSRLDSISKSIEIFKSSPLFGVGLGNYATYNQAPLKLSILQKPYQRTYTELASANPHNIFAQVLSETGLVGSITFLSLIIYFIIKDFNYIRYTEKVDFIDAYIVSSWSIFVYWLFNPATTVFIVGWFWFFRGTIEAHRIKLRVLYKK